MEENKNPKRKKVAMIIIVLLCAIGAVAYKSLSTASEETTDNAQLDGNIIACRAGITGYIREIRFTDNQFVKKGDTLIVFNTEETLAGVHQAEAALLSAQASVGAAQSRISAKQQDISAARLSTQSEEQQILAAKATLEKVQNDLHRTQKLAAIQAATQEQIENEETALKVAMANYKSLINRKNSLAGSAEGLAFQSQTEERNIGVVNAAVKQKDAELTLARENYKKTYVIAPFDGIVTKRTVQGGQFVSAGQSLCAIVSTTNIWVTANFKEVQLAHLQVGQVAAIKLDAFPDLNLSGTVESFGGATGAKFSLIPPDNATGNFIKITQRYPIRIKINNLDKVPQKLSPGLSATVSVTINH